MLAAHTACSIGKRIIGSRKKQTGKTSCYPRACQKREDYFSAESGAWRVTLFKQCCQPRKVKIVQPKIFPQTGGCFSWWREEGEGKRTIEKQNQEPPICLLPDATSPSTSPAFISNVICEDNYRTSITLISFHQESSENIFRIISLCNTIK